MSEENVELANSTSPRLWNPNAASNWSLIFSPAFGAYLHMLNWRSLGETAHAAASERWFYASMGLLALYVILGISVGNAEEADALCRVIGLFFLLAWYFGSARAQARYVKLKLGNSYVRQPWGKALGVAIGVLLIYILASFIIGYIFGAAR